MKRRIRVLVVDDEPDMRIFLCNLLGGCGYDPIPAADREKALRQALKRRPALIIMEATMPAGDGPQLFRDLQQDERLKGIPVILVSSVDRKSFREYQRFVCSLPEEIGTDGAGAYAYLKKPLDADELMGWVHALTGSPAKARPGPPG
jgi:CheY-like chemotaxis protein